MEFDKSPRIPLPVADAEGVPVGRNLHHCRTQEDVLTMVTLFAASALSSRFDALAMLGPFGLSTWVSTSVFVLVLVALVVTVFFAFLRKSAPPTIAEVLRHVESPRTPQP